MVVGSPASGLVTMAVTDHVTDGITLETVGGETTLGIAMAAVTAPAILGITNASMLMKFYLRSLVLTLIMM